MKPRPPNYLILTCLIFSAGSPAAFAGKLDVGAGYYHFQATNKRNKSSNALSGFGSYNFSYRHPAGHSFEIFAGYSLLATKTYTGDLSFGFDLGANYFPLTASGPILAQGPNANAVFQQRWRPYCGLSFHQRTFQSTSAQYSGPGLRAGTEYQWRDWMSLNGHARYLILGGPNNAEATQIDLLLGVTWGF